MRQVEHFVSDTEVIETHTLRDYPPVGSPYSSGEGEGHQNAVTYALPKGGGSLPVSALPAIFCILREPCR